MTGRHVVKMCHWFGLLSFFHMMAPMTQSENQGRPQNPPKSPNLLLIMADDLGYGALGCYGQKKVSTPRLDRMAAEGLRCTDGYAGCTFCAPSRSVLMTGKNGGHTRVRRNSAAEFLQPEDITVATLLKQAGYTSGMFGKWGLGDIQTTGAPDKHGFDRFFGYLDQVHAHFFYPDFLWDNRIKRLYPENADQGRKTYSHDELERETIGFIRAAAKASQPFFAYMPITIPHAELLVPEDSMAKYRGKFPETPYIGDHYASQPHPHAAYAGMIDRMDGTVGRLLDLLDELKISENTLVIFTSDNGPSPAGGSDTPFFLNSGPFRGQKFDMWEGGIRVPWIFRWPGRIRSGRVSDAVISFEDILPTFCQLAGVTIPGGLDGVSLVSLIDDQPFQSAPYRYWECEGKKPGQLRQALRVGDYKLVIDDPNIPALLFDLRNDPGETTDLAAREPQRYREMLKRISTAHQAPGQASN
ncbi:MAG: Arylsulfatase [Planctomycetota bacterium]|jgi:arylsulfatase A-like enzyme